MSDRRKRAGNRSERRERASNQDVAGDPAQRETWLQQAGVIVADEVLPGIEAFGAFMAEQQRKLAVMPFLDHIEGPQIIVQIFRPDGRITATLNVAVTPTGIHPYWQGESTGRIKTRWTEQVPGGGAGLTRDTVLAKLTDFYLTDFS